MHPKTKFLFTASMDVDADKEALFNEVYDTEHVPLIVTVPGVRGASRFKGEDFRMQLGGETQTKTYFEVTGIAGSCRCGHDKHASLAVS